MDTVFELFSLLRDGDEPYLRLPSPLDNIILTPPRVTDAPAMVDALNDRAIVNWLEGPPYPYLREHADNWLALTTGRYEAALQELRAAVVPNGPPNPVRSCPVQTLREVKEDGTQMFLGCLDILRCCYLGVLDVEEKDRLMQENARRPVGDPHIVWCIGDYLVSSHHGKGIMTAALATLMRWAIARMHVRTIRAEALKGNTGSVRVFEKNGFILEDTVDRRLVTNAGVSVEGLHILYWRHPDDLPQ